MPNAIKQIWNRLKTKTLARFKKKNQPLPQAPTQTPTTSPHAGNKNIFIAKRLAIAAILLALLFVVTVIAIIYWYPWKNSSATHNEIGTTSGQSTPSEPIREDLSGAHGTPDPNTHYLHWGKNTLEPGIPYFFNRAVTYKTQLDPFDTLHLKKESFENSVYWDMAYDTTRKYVAVFNNHDDRTGWGRWYVITDKNVECTVY